MGRALVSIAIIGVLAFFAVQQFGPAASVDPRVAIEEGVAKIAAQKDLKPEQRDLLRLQLAVMDFTSKNNQPPESLSELVPKYFDAVPVNPKTKAPYKYKRKGNIPLLGKQVSRDERQVVAKADTDDQKPETNAVISETQIAALGEGEDFVNPNTMVADDYVYDPTGKRDPFRPFDLTPQAVEGDELTPLQRFSLAQLRLTAVLSFGGGEPTAIVETAEGRGFTVRKGTKIGNMGGEVVSIGEDHLKILEQHTDFSGKTTERVHEMRIQVNQ